jgi:hypothetical protein
MTDTCGARSWYKAEPFFVRYRHPCHKLRAETTDCQKTFRVDGFIGWLFPPSRPDNVDNGRYQIGALKTKNAPAAIGVQIQIHS